MIGPLVVPIDGTLWPFAAGAECRLSLGRPDQ